MAMAPSTTSTVTSVLVNFNTVQSTGKLICIQTTSGQVLFTFSLTKIYQSIIYSSASLTTGTAYNLYLGGAATGTLANSIYEDGTCSGGTKYTSLTITGMVTTVR